MTVLQKIPSQASSDHFQRWVQVKFEGFYLEGIKKPTKTQMFSVEGSSKKKVAGKQLDKEDRAWLISHMEHSPEVFLSIQ